MIYIGSTVELVSGADDVYGNKFNKQITDSRLTVKDVNGPIYKLSLGEIEIETHLNNVIELFKRKEVKVEVNGRKYDRPATDTMNVQEYSNVITIQSNKYCNNMYRNVDDGMWYKELDESNVDEFE